MFAPLLFAIATAFQATAPSAVVSGRVLSESTGTPLRYAQVQVVGVRPVLMAVTDSMGVYTLRGVPAGRQLLRAQHFDHASHEVELFVPESGRVSLDVSLALSPLQLPRVTVRSRTLRDTATVPAAQLGVASAHVLEATPGMAELGLVDVIREAPGHEPVDPADVLYVRGAASDLKLVLMDGAPVYAPFHLGGLIDAFEPGVLRSAELYTGGAPARYDGGLSYVLALETRSGRHESTRAAGAIDLLSGRAHLEGPIGGRVTYLAGARGIHDLGTLRLLDHPLPYGYQDGMARVDVSLGRRGGIGITGFWNREAVSLDTVPGGPRDASWGNSAGSLRYRGPVAGTDATFTAAFGGFRARLPVGGVRPMLVDGTAHRTRYTADFRTGGALDYGFSYERLWLLYRAWPRALSADSLLMREEEEGSVGGGYVDGTWQIGSRFRVRSGVRGDVFSIVRPIRISPRLSATLLVGERSAINLAAGRYSQYVRAPEPELVLPTSEEDPFLERTPPPPLALASASHVVFGIDQEIARSLRFAVETYYKVYEGIPSARGRRSEASGVELWLRRTQGSLTGWLGYSLAWLWAEDDERSRRAEFLAGRHLVSFGMGGPVGPQGRFDIRFYYGAGLPYTAVPEPTRTPPIEADAIPSFALMDETDGAPIPSAPDEAYVRLDAGISRTWSFDWLGTHGELTPYIKLINALDRRDGLFYRYDGGEGQPRVVAALPILPVVGLQWTF